jgi:hypothetical protein
MSTRRHAPTDVIPQTDWDTVKAFFVARVGALLIPPDRPLAIQRRSVDVAKPRRRKK